MSYIEFKDVVKEYRTGEVVTRANDGINFSIERGEFVVILGPSGAGKSTTLNILGGMDKATSGVVSIDGENIAHYTQKQLTTFRRNAVGFVFQNYNLVPNLTAKENVELMIQIAKSDLIAEDVLAHCGLSHRLDNFPAQLSGGEQQRVSIARAIAGSPKLLLCDEPTGALDYETGKQILQLLQDTARHSDTTVIVITHNSTIAQMADRIIEIRNGKVKSERLNATPKAVAEISW
ncbi:ABC transporter ATP-binding protein [Tuanshanicoccus lijuaniae]|uniref:ABC transporter ATP-binding protein n=1 Tax=Aerococcaceae bacterium zg-1292 TaxID=2774330 RepID=UPI0019378886|nr:ABC transporter ATP-binding protein [Aerococcaceae bacterium zg-1292]MBD3949811.1 ABC transporter ATP-binding protein [Aerococcaceae bacterium zg-1292]QQA36945.1 ABC transporter ATP-binding protein [Aerococcaceae bacterium zg-1292]